MAAAFAAHRAGGQRDDRSDRSGSGSCDVAVSDECHRCFLE